MIVSFGQVPKSNVFFTAGMFKTNNKQFILKYLINADSAITEEEANGFPIFLPLFQKRKIKLGFIYSNLLGKILGWIV